MNAEVIGKSVEILDKGFVQLIDFLPHPASGISGDMAVVLNARASYLEGSKGEVADERLLRYMMRERHTTPFESVIFKLRLKMPLVSWWQMVRHRTMSFNLQSGRYTPFEENEFYVPTVWRKQSSSNKQGSEGIVADALDKQLLDNRIRDFYEMAYHLYEDALAIGVAKEMARLFLPGFAVYYTWYVKIDGHNLMHFLEKRLAKDAQYEIRVYAEAIYEGFFKPMLPWTAAAFEEYYLKPQGVIE